MAAPTQHRFSGPVTVFQERRLPERATPAGYSALIGAFDLQVPLPRTLSAIGERHRITEEGGWRIMTPRHAPHATLEGHLTFALKYEGLDLAVLKRLFLAAGAGAIETLVREKSTGAYARRIWFLYEWLTGRRLDLPNASTGRYVPVVDPEQQFVAKGENAPRYRVKNNLPGTPAFCPLVFRTKALEQFISLNLPDRARETVAAVPRDLLARTAAFLLLKDFTGELRHRRRAVRRRTASRDGAGRSARQGVRRWTPTSCCACRRSSWATGGSSSSAFAGRAVLSASMTARRACRCPIISTRGRRICPP